MRTKLLATAVVLPLVSAPPAHAALLDSLFGGGGLLDGIQETLADIGFSVGRFGFGPVTTREAAAANAARAAEMATAAGPTPALLAFQILHQEKLHAMSEQMWLMLEPELLNQAPRAEENAATVHDDLGTQGVSWEPAGALEQHNEAYITPMGGAVQDQAALLDRLSQMISLKTATGEELATILAAQAEAQAEDMATLQDIMAQMMAARGQTSALQNMGQLQALLITKLAQMQDSTAAFQKFLLASSASDEFERHIALTQRDFDSAGLEEAARFGIPSNQALGGGAAGGGGEGYLGY